ncbi:MAG: hypothetical protein IPM63_05640 [Acidobacteriota bacterium]|nr:MAG: hypothetical protein IPM63_05640 [Acidobacteriota bacterium]
MKRALLLFTFYLLLFTSAAAQQTASGAPGADAQWATAAKQAVGTSATTDSKIWFTLANGVLTEVYYPDLATPNVHMLQFIVVDPRTKTVETEFDDADHKIIPLSIDSLRFQQVNTAKSGKWRIAKTYVTDPSSNSLWIDVTFQPKDTGLKLYIYYDPSLASSGMGDRGSLYYCGPVSSWEKHTPERGIESGLSIEGELCGFESSDGDVVSLLSTNVPMENATNGYVRINDGLTQLRKKGKIEQEYVNAKDGNIVQVAEMPNAGKFVVTLAFGNKSDVYRVPRPFKVSPSHNSELEADKVFEDIRKSYDKGWADYVATLPKVDPKYQAQFNMAAMVLKAHEDKTFRGANVASLSIPWGGGENANEDGIGGYHLVWPRDLYHVFTAYLALGDREAAERALDYLLQRQQKPDGSFHQNTWPDGRPFFESLQMDEVAYPLIMAWQIGRTDKATYENHLKKAADFIVRNGPSTPQDRWEEESGYSPSTIAAEIAGLVCAADIARKNGDEASALIYEGAADDWVRKVDMWTATTTGKYGDGNYYLRISQNGNPDAGGKIELNNGGGTHDERDIVDAGFLELVRLGIKPADDPLIVRSLKVIDEVIRVETPSGPGFYRYNNDGYGEMDDGRRWNWDGKYSGKGKLWPLLSGERGQYELALGDPSLEQLLSLKPDVAPEIDTSGRNAPAKPQSRQGSQRSKNQELENVQQTEPVPHPPTTLSVRIDTSTIFGFPTPGRDRLDHMLAFANDGLMIPEQVWDKKETPKNIDRQFLPELEFGEGTGSATPLAWSMAQFIRLAVNLKEGKNLDTPQIVFDRYVKNTVPGNAANFGGTGETFTLPVNAGEKFSFTRDAPKGTLIGYNYRGKAHFIEVGEDRKFTVEVIAPESEETVVVGIKVPRGATAFERVNVVSADSSKPEVFPAAIEKIKSAKESPVIHDGSAYVFFRGPAQMVRFAGDNTSWAPRIALEKIGDDLHAVKLDLPQTSRLEYKLMIDGKWIRDPLNPKANSHGEGNSFLTMPGYEATTWDRNKKRGIPSESLADLEIDSAKYGKRKVKIYLPSELFRRGIAPKLPVVYFLDGSEYIDRAAAVNIAENLIEAKKVPPFMMVFTDPVDRGKEYSASDEYADYIAKEVVPAVENKYFDTVKPGRENRAIIGASLGGITSIWTALRHPDVFRNVGAQSASFWVDDERVIQRLRTLDAIKGDDFNFYLDDGLFEGTDDSRRVNVLLRGKGFPVRYIEKPTGHNWTSWRDRLAEAFIALLN